MADSTFPALTVAIAATASACLYFIYRHLLPKPLPGIPHSRISALRLLGDIPDLLRWTSKTAEPFHFFPKLCQDLGSPLVQVFLKPGKRPWVILTDAHEAHDIMFRRTSEFDRSPVFSNVFSAYMPHALTTAPTNELWRHQRRIWSDTMSPSFLHKVNGPRIHDSFVSLLDLWTRKKQIEGDTLIDIDKDVLYAGLDAIWAAQFGHSAGAIQLQLDIIHSYPPSTDQVTGVTKIPHAMLPAEVSCALTLSNSSSIANNSPFGVLHHKLALVVVPKLRSAVKAKDQLVKTEIAHAAKRLASTSEGINEDNLACAADPMVSRALRAGENLDSPSLHDDIFTYVAGGFETSATTMRWGVLLLAANQDAQHKLRSALTMIHGTTNLPTTEAITRHSSAYLDAVIEEVVRVGNTLPANMRIATVDTEILGCQIPKGTDVVMPTWGSSQTSSALPALCLNLEYSYSQPRFSFIHNLNESSKTSQKHIDDIGFWDPADAHKFRPERWLKYTEKGEEVFDAFAGPANMFGAGLRGCFGKKLAMLQLRIFFTLVIWKFEFLPTEVRLQGEQTVTRKPHDVWVRMKMLR